jgi:acyl-CoA dehydrogenase
LTSEDLIAAGRADLADWLDAQPDNYYLADDGLTRGLALQLGADDLAAFEDRLEAMGAEMARIDAAVRENNLHANLPRIDACDEVGRRTDVVVHHPTYDVVGRAIYEGGVISSYADEKWPNLKALALFYLSSLNGEAGHNCPVACTAGLVKVLSNVAGPELRDRYLGQFLLADYDQRLHAAQFLTEVQGGSDVGANSTVAVAADEPGLYHLTGEKWFCSNIGADLALLTARLEDGPKGTRGLGLFLMPLRNEDGSPNGIRLWRLKDKVGTRSMPTAEAELSKAKAWHVGEPGHGFKNMMSNVIHTSRVYNAMSVAGGMRRATIVAWTYARHRNAFGAPIGRYPLIRETLAAMRSDTAAVRAACLHLLAAQDRIERQGGDTKEARAAQRMAVNLNKTLSARIGHEVCNQGIEVLGGNGTVETFSVLPRLLRDNVVSENWEGTHNTLFVQWLRDATARDMDVPYLDSLAALIDQIEPDGDPELGALHEAAVAELATVRDECKALKDSPPELATLTVRRVGDHSCLLLYAAALLREASFAKAHGHDDAEDTALLARHFWDRRLGGDPGPASEGYLDRIEAICRRA